MMKNKLTKFRVLLMFIIFFIISGLIFSGNNNNINSKDITGLRNSAVNIEIISESDLSTRWDFVNETAGYNTIYNETFNNVSIHWYLDGVSSETFEKTPVESVNYLLDNYSLSENYVYIGNHFDTSGEVDNPTGIGYNTSHLAVADMTGQIIQLYTTAGVADGSWDISGEVGGAQGITWDGDSWWVIDIATAEVYEYNIGGIYTTAHWDTSVQAVDEKDIVWDGSDFWVLDSTNSEVYKYDAAGVYSGTHWDTSDEINFETGIAWDGAFFWVLESNVGAVDVAYRYTAAGVYTGISFITSGTTNPESITYDGNDLWVLDYTPDEVLEYTKSYDISKKYHGDGIIYVQTNETETLTLKSPNNLSLTLQEGDKIEVRFNTSSTNRIDSNLYNNSIQQESYILSIQGNGDFSTRTKTFTVSSNISVDQLEFTGIFDDTKNLIVDSILIKRSFAETISYYVEPYGRRVLDLGFPHNYTVEIYERNELMETKYITTSATLQTLIYKRIQFEIVYLTYYDANNEYLDFNLFTTYINYTLDNFTHSNKRLSSHILYVDMDSLIQFKIYDSFDVLIKDCNKYEEIFIDITLDVYSLKIKNEKLIPVEYKLKNNDTTIIKSGFLFDGEILEYNIAIGIYIFEYLKEGESTWENFTFSFTSNQIFVLNRSKMIFLTYSNQRGDYLEFNNYKTYINGTLLYENVFYRDVGINVGIEIKDRYDISIKNQTYIVVSGDNYVPIILTMYSLKVMNQQEIFNHINITRDPNYYESPFSWSEWVAPNEIIKFNLFAGYYKINLTDNEGSSYSFYEYTLNGDDILLISSDNIISQVIYNIANVNTTIGNQITNVEINITNQNSNINNTVVNIQINLSNVNSTLGSLLTNIGTIITNINTTIVSQITDLGVNLININSSISNQILSLSADLTNINSSIISQILTLGAYITNINGSIINQIVALGVDINNVEINITNQVLSLEVDISNINTSIIDQILLVVADISNVNSSIIDQTLVIISDISNVNSTIVNQMLALGVDISNVNVTIGNQILSLSVDLSNVNTSIYNLLLSVGINITNVENDIGTLYTFTNNSFINLNNAMNTSFIYMENNIYSINQSISTLVIGVDGKITIVGATINTMFTEMSNQFIVTQSTLNYSFAFLNQTIIQIGNNITTNQIALQNLIIQRANDIDSSLINIQNLINLVNNTVANESLVIQTLINLIGANITSNHIIINSLLNLIDNNITNNNIQLVSILDVIGNNITTNHFVIQTLLDLVGNNITNNHLELVTTLNLINNTMDQNQIELINRLLFINNSINEIALGLTNQLIFLNNTIYSAILDVSVSIDFASDNILGNITLTYQQNDFLTELYKRTMFSQLLNWSDVAYNYTLMEDRIDIWDFVNNYESQAIEVFLTYKGLVDSITVSAQNTVRQYLPKTNVEYKLKSVDTGEYLTMYQDLPDTKVVDFGFYEEEVPSTPSFREPNIFLFLIFGVVIVMIVVISIIAVITREKKKVEYPKKKAPKGKAVGVRHRSRHK